MSATAHGFSVDPADAHLQDLAAALPALRQHAERALRATRSAARAEPASAAM